MPLRGVAMFPKEPDPPDIVPPLPRPLDEGNEIRRLREEARRNLDAEERPPAAVYGGPTPVYGGPPFGGGSVSRRWTLKRIFLVLFGLIAAALAALFFGRRPGPGPGNVIYGGPPPRPDPGPANPVYGGPVPPPDPKGALKKRKPSPRKPAAPKPPSGPPPAAAVYGGPAPRPPQPPAPTEPPQ